MEESLYVHDAVEPLTSTQLVCIYIIASVCYCITIPSRSVQKQSTLEAMSPAYWEQSGSDPVTGLVRLFMEEIQEGERVCPHVCLCAWACCMWVYACTHVHTCMCVLSV